MDGFRKDVKAAMGKTSTGKLYCVQVGAYSKKSNADAMAKKLEAAGFDAYVTTK